MSRYSRLKAVDVEKNNDDRNYNQYDQVSSIQYTLCIKSADGKYLEQFKPVTCRELWSDAILHGLLGVKSYEIFGFYTNKPINVDNYALSIYMNEEVVNTFIHNIRIMDRFFSKQGLEKCKIYRTNLSDGYTSNLLIEFDRFWITSPILASIHSLFFRACSYRDITESTFRKLIVRLINEDNSDDVYLNSVVNTLGLNKLVFILKEMTKEHPITGINDEYIKKELQDEEDKCNLNEHTQVIASYSNKHSVVTYTLYYAHICNGFYNTLSHYRNIRSTFRERDISIRIGYRWFHNLHTLLNSPDFTYKTIKV